MKVLLYTCTLLYCLLAFGHAVYSQQDQTGTDNIDKAIHFPDKVFSRLNDKASFLNKQLDKQTERYLNRMAKQEAKLRKKIAAKDSALAKKLFDGVQEKYQQLQTAPGSVSKYASVYSSGLDSLNTSLNFLKTNNIGNVANNPELQKALASYAALQNKLNATDQIRQYLAQRRQLLQQQLQQLGMMKEFNQFKQQTAYYQAQVQEYKNILNEPSKLESTLLSIAQKIPSFKSFFANQSLLGNLFALPGGAASAAAANGVIPAGLQTRAMVNQALVSQFGSMEAVTEALQQAVPSAQSQLQQLKDKLSQYTSGSYGNGGASSEMPEQPIDQNKVKSFWRRVYFSGGMSSQKAYSILPVTSQVSAALNYKLSEKKVLGVALAGSIGWGSGWRHIKLSSQGASARGFIDLKLKGSFWFSASYELNYRPGLSALDSAVKAQGEQIKLIQPAGLVGLSKIVSMKGKVAKKTKVSFLWDYLSYRTNPRPPAFTWRVEYAFK